MKTIPSVSDKDTKGTIIEKYNILEAMYKEKDAAKLDPAKEVAQKATAAVISKAEAIVKTDINSQINQITETVTSALCDALSGINVRVADYNDLDTAIAIKKQELKDLFGIEASSYALVTLMNMQDEQKAAYAVKMADEKEQKTAELNTLIEQIQQKRNEFNAEMNLKQKELETSRKREADEYKYTLDRNRKQEADKIADERAAALKEFNAALSIEKDRLDDVSKTLDARASEIATRESVMDILQAKVDTIPSQIEAAVAQAVKATQASADKSAQFVKQMLEKDMVAAKQLAEAKNETLVNSLAEEKARGISLSAKLDEAYAKIENISGKAVEAAAGSRFVDRLENTYKEQGKQSTGK